MSKVYNIVMIGAGQLGSRHLQSLASLNLPANIFVYDVSLESLSISKERFYCQGVCENIKSIEFTDSFEKIPEIIDFLLISTNSKNRSELIKRIVLKSNVQYMLLEKVLFQTVEEYYEIKELINSHNIKTWVNCPFRIYDVYQKLKSILCTEDSIYCTVDGGNWGMACNSIHYIDLFSFLIDSESYKVNIKGIDDQVIESKREGYKEFTGVLECEFSNSSKLTIISRRRGGRPITMVINDCEKTIVVEESELKLTVLSKQPELNKVRDAFVIPYQSQLTRFVVEDILSKGDCSLSTYNGSMNLHLPLIEGFLNFLNLNSKELVKICPIT